MTRREQLLQVYKHKNIGYVPCFFTDFDYLKPEAINERAEGGGFDWFGVEWEFEAEVMAPMVKPGTKRLKDITNWKEELVFPDLSGFDWEALAAKETAKWDRENKISYMMLINGIFERTHALMGFEDALCAMYEEPEALHELIEAITDYKIELIRIIGKYYKPDVLMFHDDWGTQNNMFFSPDVWRSLIKPQIKKAVDRCHELGVLFDMHSCGKIEAVVPEFVELGIDAWQGMEINDIPKLKSITGMNLGYHTTPDYQGYQTEALAGTLTEEDLRKRVREVFEKTAEGYCYCPMFLPFGGWSTEVMIDEIMKCGKTIYKDA